MSLLEHFDLLAPLYDRLIRPPIDDRLAELAGLPIRGELLDAGGGTGRIASRLIGRAGRVIVADASRPMLAEAWRKHGLASVTSHTERLPFADGRFERVIMVDAYHHVEDQIATLRELWRVLAPGGRLVLEEPDIRDLSVRLISLGEKLLLMRSHFETGEVIAARLASLGAQTSLHHDRHTAWIVADKP